MRCEYEENEFAKMYKSLFPEEVNNNNHNTGRDGGFYTDDDYEPNKLKFNIKKDLSIERIGPKPKRKKFAGFVLEVIPGQGFSFDTVFEDR